MDSLFWFQQKRLVISLPHCWSGYDMLPIKIEIIHCLLQYMTKAARIVDMNKVCVKPWSWLAHSCQSLSWFVQHEAARTICTPPGQDDSPSQVTPPQFLRFPQQFAHTHLHFWVERGTVKVKCLAQEHNTMSQARARTRTACSGDECTNHEATMPPLLIWILMINLFSS